MRQRELAACVQCCRTIWTTAHSTRADAGYCAVCWGKKPPPKVARQRQPFAALCVRLSCAGCNQTFLRLRWEYEARQRYGQRKFYCSLSCFAKHGRSRVMGRTLQIVQLSE